MHFAVPGGKVGLLITLLLGALIGLLSLLQLAQAAILPGLATITFVLFSAWAVVSRMRGADRPRERRRSYQDGPNAEGLLNKKI
jgi:hypothetical protein